MTRHLTLLRHAQAEPHSHTGEDIDRPLDLQGREQAAGIGPLLREHGVVPDVVLVSAALRAVQTWQLASAELPEGIEVTIVPELYGADARDLLDLIGTHAGRATSVLVVGHEPVISLVAHTLADEHSDDAARQRVSTGVSTAMLAFLRTERDWADLERDTATLVGLDRPEGERTPG